MLTCEEVVSPALFARRGLLAGCPLAPMLSKIALYSPLSAVLNGRRCIAGADVWIDDISVDLEDQSAEKAAGNARLLYKQLSQALGGGGHSISTKKTFFVASSSRASKALSSILEDGDPEVRSIGKDLGVGTSGAKRRSTGAATKRLDKAKRRLKKLQALRVPNQGVRARLFNASVMTSGLWGHQGQGVSPKVRKDIRAQAAQIGGKQPQGSIDIALDIADKGVKDPEEGLILQHWMSIAKLLQNSQSRDWILRTWQVLWKQPQGKHRWKSVVGPLGGLVCYMQLDVGIETRQLHAWETASQTGTREKVSFSLQDRHFPYKGKQLLKQAVEQKRRARLADQTGCPAAANGIDWTEARQLLKKFKNKKKATYLRSVWQGCFNVPSSAGTYMCSKCGVEANEEHALVQCSWWQEQGQAAPIWWRREPDLPDLL